MTSKNITKDMTIVSILELKPDSIETMLNFGLHCIGCGASAYETLEEGMKAHGFSDDNIDVLVLKLNA